MVYCVNICYYSGLIVFISGLVVFVLNWNHLIMSLLALEIMTLALYFLFSSSVDLLGVSFGVLFYISLAVCEGCLGLSVFVNMVCSEGSDKMNLLNYLKW
uniref:NADH dehydrogenase subunit 4L n=1 Tax=Ichthyoxenos japonensis TaxID=2033261 RepID=UPI000EF29616|nr:NADH dehydrogenase subunit 4L [Ichthyoxenos japonensis]ATO58530.1 NADH dehydrogenase subunit 4L [Ichthyoxenos japonensis]